MRRVQCARPRRHGNAMGRIASCRYAIAGSRCSRAAPLRRQHRLDDPAARSERMRQPVRRTVAQRHRARADRRRAQPIRRTRRRSRPVRAARRATRQRRHIEQVGHRRAPHGIARRRADRHGQIDVAVRFRFAVERRTEHVNRLQRRCRDAEMPRCRDAARSSRMQPPRGRRSRRERSSRSRSSRQARAIRAQRAAGYPATRAGTNPDTAIRPSSRMPRGTGCASHRASRAA